MEDFNTLNQIINESIRNSSYVSVIISSCVFIIYSLINKIVEVVKQKDRNKPLLEMASAIKDISSNVVMLNNVLNKTIQDSERKEISKAKNVVSLVFNSFQANIIQKCNEMIVHNHINDNKTLITENVNKLVSTEYYKTYSILSNYEIKDSIISSKLKEEWIKELTDDILMIMYNQQDDVTRIIQLNNKVSLDLTEYATYVINKTFN